MDHELYVVQPPTDDSNDTLLSPDYAYKFSDAEMVKFVRLRAANDTLFTGKRNTSVVAWRAILKEMGIHKKMSTSQARKKWENLKKKYREMKNPPPGIAVNPTNWQWFSLMEDAMEGRLNDSESTLSTAALGDDSEFRPDKPRKRSQGSSYRGEIELLFEGDEAALSRNGGEVGSERDHLDDEEEAEQAQLALEAERAALEDERLALERDKTALERERAAVERELAASERERATLERERASMERERAAMEHERASLDREQAVLDRERAALQRGREALDRRRESAGLEIPPRGGDGDDAHGEDESLLTPVPGREKTGQVEMEPASVERRQKFLDLFEKLIENF